MLNKIDIPPIRIKVAPPDPSEILPSLFSRYQVILTGELRSERPFGRKVQLKVVDDIIHYSDSVINAMILT